MSEQRKLILLLTLCLCIFTGLARAKKPNILLITADDLGWDTPGCYGNKTPEITPNIDALAADGLRFTHGYVTATVCQPSRSTWITGRYPFRHGAVGFNPILPDVPTLGAGMRDAGYYTGLIEKVAHYQPVTERDWDYVPERMGEHGRSATLYNEVVDEFLHRAETVEKPFFLIVNIHDPHRPLSGGEFEKTAYKDDMPPPPSRIYSPDEIEMMGYIPDTPESRENVSFYYNSAKRCDDIVGAIMESYRDAGLEGDEDTIVMFTSDHGPPLPFAKGNVYRQSVNVPWIVKWPGTIEGGSVDATHFIGGTDLMPTVLELAGAPLPAHMDGSSFLPVLKGESQPGRDHVFGMFHRDQFRVLEMRAIHTEKYGYIYNAWDAWEDGDTTFVADNIIGMLHPGAERDPAVRARLDFYLQRAPEELYDYDKDPHSLNNLAEDPEYADVMKRMRSQMRRMMNQKGDPLFWGFVFYMNSLK